VRRLQVRHDRGDVAAIRISWAGSCTADHAEYQNVAIALAALAMIEEQKRWRGDPWPCRFSGVAAFVSERRRRLRDGGFSARSGGTDLAGLAILVC